MGVRGQIDESRRGRRARLGLACVFAAPWGALPAAYGEPLEEARRALEQGDEQAAYRLYQAIRPKDSQWRDKIEDGIRYQFLKRNFLEAWRLYQIGRRTGVATPEHSYY